MRVAPSGETARVRPFVYVTIAGAAARRRHHGPRLRLPLHTRDEHPHTTQAPVIVPRLVWRRLQLRYLDGPAHVCGLAR